MGSLTGRFSVARQALAAVLLVGFCFPTVAPLFTTGPDQAELPACCRRNGKHHCMMYMMLHDGGKYRYITEKCPYSPFAGVALMLPHLFQNQDRPAVRAQSASLAELVCEAEAGFRISGDRTRQKRGPPGLLRA